MTFGQWIFGIVFFVVKSGALQALSSPGEIKNTACVLVQHHVQTRKQAAQSLNLSSQHKQLAEKTAQKVLSGNVPLHPIIREVLQGSVHDSYILRHLCAQKKLFGENNDTP